MKKLAIAVLLLSAACFAQTQSNPFSETTYSFGLTPITLPGTQQTLSGAESDIMIHATPNNEFGQTTLVSTATFIGGRYNRVFPSVGKFLQNHTQLTGFNFQAYMTASVGIVKGDQTHWGERAGLGLRWAPSGASSFSVAFEAQANNLPGISHWIPSVAVSPQFRF